MNTGIDQIRLKINKSTNITKYIIQISHVKYNKYVYKHTYIYPTASDLLFTGKSSRSTDKEAFQTDSKRKPLG